MSQPEDDLELVLMIESRAESLIASVESATKGRSLTWPIRLPVPVLLPPAAPFELPADIEGLTAREIEVMAWLAAGKSDWQIGQILMISAKTVNYHVEKVKKKFRVATRMQAAVVAVRMGLLEAPLLLENSDLEDCID